MGVHRHGDPEPWFSVPLPAGGPFEALHVFSLSTYLRGLDEDVLELLLPHAAARVGWLSRLLIWP